MKQVFVSKGKASVHEVGIPSLEDGMVLIRVHYSFISSGTEIATLNASGKSIVSRAFQNIDKTARKINSAVKEHGIIGTVNLIRSSLSKLLAVGYSCSGQVIEAASGTGFSPGDWVACAGSGFAVHAEFAAVPKNLVVRLAGPEKLKESSVVAIASVALQGFRRSGAALGESVCVVGLGLIGQLTVNLARLAGCRVFGVDIDANRLKVGKESGCCRVFDASDKNLQCSLNEATSGHGVDCTIVTAASRSGGVIQQAISLTRRRGKVVVVGDVKLDFDREEFYRKELDLCMSCSYGPGRYDQQYEKSGLLYPYDFVRWTETRNMQFIVDTIGRGVLNVNSLVYKTFSVNEADKAYDCLEKKRPLGLVLTHAAEQKPSYSAHMKPKVCKVAPVDGRVRVALIGAGGFAKTKLLPILREMDGVVVSNIIGSSASGVLNVAQQFSIPEFGTNFDDVLNDQNINAVVIATPHKFHANQALKALNNGKAVFCEKPAAITFDQLAELKNFFSKTEVAYQVDFNRSCAPFINRIKYAVAGRSTPLQLTYRMNAGAVPDGHWLKLPEHGGRIIGEMCHLFELALNVVNSKPSRISVVVSRGKTSLSDPRENVTVSLSFRDGSCANIVYTSLGNSAMQKERMEAFWEGKSLVLDDFISLKGYGVGTNFDQKVSYQDKGHKACLKSFFASVSAGKPMDRLVLESVFTATQISLIVDNLAQAGGGEYSFELLQQRNSVLCAV
ncbi:bi-domain-containing oxidoreductase [Candidatus Babeliales bacterium]|nr:bi-domain-containing oxidoreductase [Candidatus Babeliales bacterium]